MVDHEEAVQAARVHSVDVAVLDRLDPGLLVGAILRDVSCLAAAEALALVGRDRRLGAAARVLLEAVRALAGPGRDAGMHSTRPAHGAYLLEGGDEVLDVVDVGKVHAIVLVLRRRRRRTWRLLGHVMDRELLPVHQNFAGLRDDHIPELME